MPALRCKECIDPAPFADMLEFREQRWLYAQRLEAPHIARGFDAASTEYVRPVYLVFVAYSTGYRRSRQPKPGRHSTYQTGYSVQTNGATSLLSF